MGPNSLHNISERITTLATLLGAPPELWPTFVHTEDGARPHIEVDEGTLLHYVIVEHGQELRRDTTSSLDELLYLVFVDISFELASRHELTHRRAGEDFRRQLFATQLHLLATLDPDWAARCRARLCQVLARHPFSDSLEPKDRC